MNCFSFERLETGYLLYTSLKKHTYLGSRLRPVLTKRRIHLAAIVGFITLLKLVDFYFTKNVNTNAKNLQIINKVYGMSNSYDKEIIFLSFGFVLQLSVQLHVCLRVAITQFIVYAQFCKNIVQYISTVKDLVKTLSGYFFSFFQALMLLYPKGRRVNRVQKNDK